MAPLLHPLPAKPVHTNLPPLRRNPAVQARWAAAPSAQDCCHQKTRTDPPSTTLPEPAPPRAANPFATRPGHGSDRGPGRFQGRNTRRPAPRETAPKNTPWSTPSGLTTHKRKAASTTPEDDASTPGAKRQRTTTAHSRAGPSSAVSPPAASPPALSTSASSRPIKKAKASTKPKEDLSFSAPGPSINAPVASIPVVTRSTDKRKASTTEEDDEPISKPAAKRQRVTAPALVSGPSAAAVVAPIDSTITPVTSTAAPVLVPRAPLPAPIPAVTQGVAPADSIITASVVCSPEPEPVPAVVDAVTAPSPTISRVVTPADSIIAAPSPVRFGSAIHSPSPEQVPDIDLAAAPSSTINTRVVTPAVPIIAASVIRSPSSSPEPVPDTDRAAAPLSIISREVTPDDSIPADAVPIYAPEYEPVEPTILSKSDDAAYLSVRVNGPGPVTSGLYLVDSTVLSGFSTWWAGQDADASFYEMNLNLRGFGLEDKEDEVLSLLEKILKMMHMSAGRNDDDHKFSVEEIWLAGLVYGVLGLPKGVAKRVKDCLGEFCDQVERETEARVEIEKGLAAALAFGWEDHWQKLARALALYCCVRGGKLVLKGQGGEERVVEVEALCGRSSFDRVVEARGGMVGDMASRAMTYLQTCTTIALEETCRGAECGAARICAINTVLQAAGLFPWHQGPAELAGDRSVSEIITVLMNCRKGAGGLSEDGTPDPLVADMAGSCSGCAEMGVSASYLAPLLGLFVEVANGVREKLVQGMEYPGTL